MVAHHKTASVIGVYGKDICFGLVLAWNLEKIHSLFACFFYMNTAGQYIFWFLIKCLRLL